MARIKLAEQETYEFEYKTGIKVRDVNYGGHLSNDAVVGILHEARIALLKKLGCTELDLGDGEAGLIMADLAVVFKAQGYMHDRISVLCHIDQIKTVGFKIFYKIIRGEELIVLAETQMAAIKYGSGELAPLPASFVENVGKLS